MPYYQVFHGIPLSDAQKEKIAGAITNVHAKQFHVLTEFVNVSFLDTGNMSFYRGGKPKTGVNSIVSCGIKLQPHSPQEAHVGILTHMI
jgi:phenylpyruvate tautomerase PptA (4-oxalocrotonate tautomerase family)